MNNDDDKLKETGRKARERLQEERSKRKEIVRIEESDDFVSNQTPNLRPYSNFSKAIKEETQKRKKTTVSRNKLSGHSATTDRSRKRRRGTSPLSAIETNLTEKVDEWVPFTQKIFNTLDKRDKMYHSNIVRIHGFPIGANEKNLRKFFTGLSLEKIFTIPAFEREIPNFDLKDTDSARETSFSASKGSKKRAYSRQVSLERHRSTVRIFCKFKTKSAAQAALERSGEIIFFNDENDKIGAAIAIVPISKSISEHLERNMALGWIKGQDLDLVMELAEEKVPIHIRKILWVMLARKLKQDLEIPIYINENRSTNNETDSDHDGISCRELLEYGPESNPRYLVILHNKVLDLYVMLKRSYPLYMTEFDPSIPPSDYLQCFYAASQWLLMEMRLIKNCLHQARTFCTVVDVEVKNQNPDTLYEAMNSKADC